MAETDEEVVKFVVLSYIVVQFPSTIDCFSSKIDAFSIQCV
jgi:hypothetical protein